MKRFLGILFILVLCTVSVSALADGETVSAIGTATVTLVPDMASFSVGVTTQDALITVAQSANAEAMQNIINTMVTLGVSREDIQTNQYSVYPVYDYQSGTPTVTGYEVSNTVTVVVRVLDQIPSMLDAAVEAGANNVYSLSFQSAEQAAAYDQALKAAAQDALRKASLMAQAVGREAGNPLSLTESAGVSSYYSSESIAYALDSSYSTPIESGMIAVTAEVVAVVELK